MPVTHAAAKSLRQSKRRTAQNASVKAQLHYLVKQVRKAVLAKTVAEARNFLGQAIKAYDKAVQNRVIPKNTANRMKSRLTRAVSALTG